MAPILALLCIIFIFIYMKQRKRLRDEPPLVPGHWFFGNALDFSKDSVGFLLRNQELYGDAFTLRLMSHHLTIIMDPQFYDQIGKHKNLSFDQIQQQVNWNVFGYEVRDTKTLLRETGISMRGKHQTEALRSFLDNLESSIRELKCSLNLGANRMELRPLVVSTLFSTIFTSIFGSERDENFNSRAVHKNFEVFHKYFNFLWLGMPIWLFPEAQRALTNLHNMPSAESLLSRKDLSFYLRRAIGHMLSQNQTETDIKGHNLVYLHVNYNTFRLAYWALYFLLKNDSARASIMEELRVTLAGFEDGSVELSEGLINRMHHLESFVQETCRLSSGVFIVRHVTSKTAISLRNGHVFTLRAGDKVAMYPPSIHKDPTVFDDPKDFKHDRFLDRKRSKQGLELPCPVMSFGTLCPGKRYALLQLKLFIIVMLMRFDMDLKDDVMLPFDEVFSGHEVLPPKGDVDIRLSSRGFQSSISFRDS